MRKKRLRRRAMLLLLVSVALMGSAAAIAEAVHYHHFHEWHGLVHGSSTTDGYWHSRLEANGSTSDYRNCAAYSAGDAHTSYRTYIGSTTVTGWSTWCTYSVGPASGVVEEYEAEAWLHAKRYGGNLITSHPHYCDYFAHPSCGH